MNVEFDRDYLVDLMFAIQGDVDNLLATISLKDLLETHSAERIVQAARDFRTACVNLGAVATNALGPEDIVWEQLTFDVRWNDLREQLSALKVTAVDRRLAAAGVSVELLRQMLGNRTMTDDVDWLNDIAQLNVLTRQFVDLAGNLSRDRNQEQSLRRSIVQLAAQLNAVAHTIQDRTTTVGEPSRKRIDADDLKQLARTWDQLRPLLVQVPDPYREPVVACEPKSNRSSSACKFDLQSNRLGLSNRQNRI